MGQSTIAANKQLSKLRKIVLEGGFDVESRQELSALEDRLHRVLITERLKDHPVIKEFTDYLAIEIDRCTYLLSNDETLNESQRNQLFAKREVANKFLSLFVSGRAAVENEINHLLDVASSN